MGERGDSERHLAVEAAARAEKELEHAALERQRWEQDPEALVHRHVEAKHREAERLHREAAELHERAARLLDAHDDPAVPESEAVVIADEVIRQGQESRIHRDR